MATLSAAPRVLGLDRGRWSHVGSGTLTAATAWVIVASVFLALDRFGGLATSEPRSFVRLALVGVWGWLGISLVAWVVVSFPVGRSRAHPTPRSVLAVVGVAHVPMVWLAATLFLAAGALQLLWPGFVMAVFVLAIWFPASLFRGLQVGCGLSVGRALVATAVSYAAWSAVIGRELQAQLGHLV